MRKLGPERNNFQRHADSSDQTEAEPQHSQLYAPCPHSNPSCPLLSSFYGSKSQLSPGCRLPAPGVAVLPECGPEQSF